MKQKKIITKGRFDRYYAILPSIEIDTGIFKRFIMFHFLKWYIKIEWIPDRAKFVKTY